MEGTRLKAAVAEVESLDQEGRGIAHVDGKVVCQSGMMTTRDPARLLVIEGLADAKEFKLVTRLDSDADNEHFLSTWADANFYQQRDKDDQADAAK